MKEEKTYKIHRMDVAGLSIKDKSKFLELYELKKNSMKDVEIVNLWNRFIKKPEQFVVYI